MDPGGLLLVIGLPATAVLLIVTYVRRPDQRGLARRGVRNALIAALVLASVLGGAITLLTNCSDGFLCANSLAGAFAGGLFVGGFAGGAFFWLNIVILFIGLWFRPGGGWAIAAVAATPIVIAAAVFGASAYNSYRDQQGYVSGTFGLEMDGDRLGHISANGTAACVLGVEGEYLSVDGQGSTTDGRVMDFQLGMMEIGVVYRVSIDVDQEYVRVESYTQPSTDAIQLVAGWSRAQGQLTFRDLVPLATTERWSGTFNWTCASRP